MIFQLKFKGAISLILVKFLDWIVTSEIPSDSTESRSIYRSTLIMFAPWKYDLSGYVATSVYMCVCSNKEINRSAQTGIHIQY